MKSKTYSILHSFDKKTAGFGVVGFFMSILLRLL